MGADRNGSGQQALKRREAARSANSHPRTEEEIRCAVCRAPPPRRRRTGGRGHGQGRNTDPEPRVYALPGADRPGPGLLVCGEGACASTSATAGASPAARPHLPKANPRRYPSAARFRIRGTPSRMGGRSRCPVFHAGSTEGAAGSPKDGSRAARASPSCRTRATLAHEARAGTGDAPPRGIPSVPAAAACYVFSDRAGSTHSGKTTGASPYAAICAPYPRAACAEPAERSCGHATSTSTARSRA